LDPFDDEMIQPASVDVRIDRYFRLFDNHKHALIDPAIEQPDLTREVAVDPDEAYMLHPGEFVLASTYEQITLPDDVAARLEGKSSLGRLGLLTHSTAGFIDPGFQGHITLELSNMATLPVALWPGMKIGQLCFFRLSSTSARPYGSAGNLNRYLGQRGPGPGPDSCCGGAPSPARCGRWCATCARTLSRTRTARSSSGAACAWSRPPHPAVPGAGPWRPRGCGRTRCPRGWATPTATAAP